MSVTCRITGCKAAIPAELETHELCLVHFTLDVEWRCNDLRLEAREASDARRGEIKQFIAEHGALLAHIATSSPRLPDEQKARILSTFLTLMNLRESVERAAARLATAPSPSTAKA